MSGLKVEYSIDDAFTESEVFQSAFDILTEEIQKEINFEILLNLRIAEKRDLGWKLVKLEHDEDSTLDWLKENAQGAWDHIGRYHFFELESDATMFALKWAGNGISDY